MMFANANALPWRDSSVAFLLGSVSIVFFLLNIDFASTGDAIYYANIIDTREFGVLTAHQGYYVLGWLFVEPLDLIFGVTTDQALACMSAFFASGALAIGFLLAKHLLESTKAAFFTIVVMALSHRFYVNSVSAEIYIVQAFFLWSSILSFERERFWISGLLLAFAFWVTPLTFAFCLWFPVSALLRRVPLKSLVITAVPVIVLYGSFLLLFYEELLWGNRGLINEDVRREILIGEGLANFLKYQIKHYTILNVLFIPAAFAFYRYRKLFWCSLAMSLPNLYVISQLRGEDNVFILPLDILMALWMAIGAMHLVARGRRAVVGILLASYIAIFIVSERPFLGESGAAFPQYMRQIGEVVSAEPDGVLLITWSWRMAFVYFNRGVPSYPLEGGRWYEMSFPAELPFDAHAQVGHDEKLREDLAGRTVFALESWAVSGRAAVFLSDEQVRRRKEAFSDITNLERRLDLSCVPDPSGIDKFYRCEANP